MFSRLDASSKEAKARYPGDSDTVEDFSWALKEACRSRYKRALNDPDMRPMRAEAQFFLSRDRLCAYGCLLPPENDGDEITLEQFLEDIHYEGIRFGLLDDEIRRGFALGYLHIFPVARGKAASPGEDGKVTELFQRRRNMRLEVQNGSEVDFSHDIPLQPVRKGTAICLIRPPRAGTDGMDVTGQTIPSPPALGAYVPQGENTALGRGGQALIASEDGILYIENERFHIHSQKIIDGSLDQFQGVLRISGNLYIGGNVDGGVEVEASGDIVINGKIGRARVTSAGGTIRVQQGIYGTEGETSLTAACQVQSPTVERAEITAGTSVITQTIVNSTVCCDGTVYVMSGRGMVAGSRIQAGDSLLCLRIGNLAGGRSQISVGYPPNVLESWARTKAELAKVQEDYVKLWEPIAALRKKGARISEEEKSLLEQMLKQREIYDQKQETLLAELKAINKALDKRSKGKIRCEKLYPSLDVQIGRLREEVTTVEEFCSIHAEGNQIVLK